MKFLLMMMIVPNSLVRQKEGAQGEKEAEGRRKGGSTETLTSGADASTGPTRPSVSDARNRRKHGQWCGVPLHRRSSEDYELVLSSHDRNGGSYRRINEVLKG